MPDWCAGALHAPVYQFRVKVLLKAGWPADVYEEGQIVLETEKENS